MEFPYTFEIIMAANFRFLLDIPSKENFNVGSESEFLEKPSEWRTLTKGFSNIDKCTWI